MAKKAQPKQIDYKSVQWVIDNLRAEELAQMDATEISQDDLLSWLSERVEEDYKISLKWDYFSGSLQGTMVQMSEGKDNAGYAISARSDDLKDVLKILFWKYEHIAGGDLAAVVGEGSFNRG